jgi:crotonobetainyl-CoA:carnitine CoA-transferase CaiB-like acyl-CoA transferase
MELPLEGFQVSGLTRAPTGSFYSSNLADLDSNAMKVEPLSSGDTIRTQEAFEQNLSAYYFSINRNKRDAAVNLRGRRGLDGFGNYGELLEEFSTDVVRNCTIPSYG